MADVTKVDARTGEVAVYDDETWQKIRVIKPGRTLPSTLGLEKPSVVMGEPPQAAVSPLRFLGEALPVGGSILGSIYGGGPAVGGSLGTAAGSSIQQALQNFNPELFGEPGGIAQVGADVAGNLVGEGAIGVSKYGIKAVANRGEPILRAAIAKLFTGSDVPETIGKYLIDNPDIPVTAGQLGNSEATAFLENLFTPRLKPKVIGKQQTGFKEKFKEKVFESIEEAEKTYGKRVVPFKVTPQMDDLLKFRKEIDQAIFNVSAESAENLLKKPELLKRTLDSFANPEPIRKLMGARYLSNIFDDATINNKVLNPKTLRENLFGYRKNAMVQTLFTAPEQANLRALFSTLEALPSTVGKSGLHSLSWRVIGGSALIAGTLASAAATGELSTSLLYGGTPLALAFTGNQLASRVLLNDRAVRLATQLAKLKPESPTAKNVARLFFASIKGAQGYLLAPDGKRIPVKVNDKGKLEESKEPVPEFLER